jgi:hypothetical protein
MSLAAREMAMVHRVFRNELRSAPQLIRTVRDGHVNRSKLVADHLANLFSALHHHHSADHVQRMLTQHERISDSVHKVESILTAWTTAGDLATAEELIDEIQRLADVVIEHLDEEEAQVVPLIDAYISPHEWREATDRGASFVNRKNIRFGVAFVALVLESAPRGDRRPFLAGMPQPQRVMLRLFGKHVLTAYRSTLYRNSE